MIEGIDVRASVHAQLATVRTVAGFGEFLRWLRRSRSLSLRDLEKAVARRSFPRISKSSLGRFENGRLPESDQLRAILVACDIEDSDTHRAADALRATLESEQNGPVKQTGAVAAPQTRRAATQTRSNFKRLWHAATLLTATIASLPAAESAPRASTPVQGECGPVETGSDDAYSYWFEPCWRGDEATVWVRDNKKDGRCVQAYVLFDRPDAAPDEVRAARACPAGQGDTFRVDSPPDSTGARLVLRLPYVG